MLRPCCSEALTAHAQSVRHIDLRTAHAQSAFATIIYTATQHELLHYASSHCSINNDTTSTDSFITVQLHRYVKVHCDTESILFISEFYRIYILNLFYCRYEYHLQCMSRPSDGRISAVFWMSLAMHVVQTRVC